MLASIAQSKSYLLLIVLCLSMALLLAGCQDSSSDTSIIVSGSTTVLPIAEQAAEQFMELAANEDASVLVSGMGSSAGIEAVSNGTAQIGTSSRELKDTEQDLGLVDTPIAHDGIAVIVNPSNPITELSLEQLRSVFSGEITNWSQLGGSDIPIDLINRDEASGTREAFSKVVMQDATFDIGAVILPGTGQVRDVVSRSEGAIGYISVGFVEPRFTNTRVKALVIAGNDPTEANVANGTYPISRSLHFFTKGSPEGLVKSYIEYVLSDKVQQGAVIEAGFVPVGVTEGK